MNRMKKIAVAAAAAVSLALTGCAGGGAADAGGESKGALAMTFAGLDIQIWNDELKYMKPVIEEAGYEFLSNDPGWDIQTQVADVESWIQRGDVKAIMAYPVQSDSMNAVTQQAIDAGIPVVGYAVKWEGVDYGLVIDNYGDGLALGKAAGEWIIEKYGKDKPVPIVLFGYRDNDLGLDRTQGVLDGLEEVGANVTINELNPLTLDEGYAAVQSALSANPDNKVFVSISGDGMAGGYQALLDSGVAEDDSDYLVASLDATVATLEALQIPDSIWRIAFGFSAKTLGEANAELLIKAAEGKLDGDFDIASTRITTKNLAEFQVD